MPPSAEKVRQHNLKVGKQSRSGEMDSCRYCFEGSDDADGARPNSVDMLKQLLMHEITEASRRLLGNCQRNCRTVPGNFQMKSERCYHEVFLCVRRSLPWKKQGAIVRSYSKVDH